MSEQISTKLKKLQTDIKVNKQLPMVVADTQKEVQRLNFFIKSFLKKENAIVLPKDVQANVLQGLVEVNRMFTQLSQNCRSDHHFQMYKEQFLQMRREIQDLIFCTNLSIENGFYDFEARGFRLSQSLELSWQGIQKIHESITHTAGGKYLPYVLTHNPKLIKQIHELYEALAPLATAVLKLEKKSEFSEFFTMDELKIINRFFKQVRDFHQTIEHQYLDRTNTKEILSQINIDSIDQIFKELHDLEHNIQRYLSGTDALLLMDSVHFDETTTNDLHARMSAIYVQLEGARVLTERYHTVESILTHASPMEGIREFSKIVSFEKKQLEFFIKYFSRIHQSLRGVSSILTNLSISFGKIFQLSLKSDLTLAFLTRAIQTAHNLLTKSIKFAEARKTDAQQLQLALQKATLFHKAVEGMIFSAFKELEDAKQAIINYDQKLMKKLEQAAQQKKLSPAMIQQILKETYEDRTELSTAAIYLHNISYNFELLVNELNTIDSAFQQFHIEFSSEEEAQHAMEETFYVLEKTSESPPELLQSLWMSVQHLHWYIEEILLDNLRENRRFQKDFDTIIAPVKKRIEERIIQQKQEVPKEVTTPQEQIEDSPPASQGESPSPIPIPEKTAEDVPIPEKAKGDIPIPEKAKGDIPIPEKAKGDIPIPEKPSEEISIPGIKIRKKTASLYDPFLPKTMEDLKKFCRKIGTARILSVLEVVERPHAFFNFLDRLEEEYDPEAPFTETLWLAEVEESQSAIDFILGFAKVKFLPHGYFNANGVAIPYNQETKKIQKPMGVDLYLKISNRYMETPKGIFKRLMLIMLGYEDANILGIEENMKLISLLNMDYVITAEEREALHVIQPFLS